VRSKTAPENAAAAWCPAVLCSTTSPEFVRVLDADWLLISDFVISAAAVGVLKLPRDF